MCRREDTTLADQLATLFGIYTAFSSSALAAPTLTTATVMPEIDHVIDIGDQLFTAITLNVRAHDEFVGQRIGQLRKRTNMLVIALRRDGTRMHHLKLDTTLNVGDEILCWSISPNWRNYVRMAIIPAKSEPGNWSREKPASLKRNIECRENNERDSSVQNIDSQTH